MKAPTFTIPEVETVVAQLDTQFLLALSHFGMTLNDGACVVRIRLADELARRLRKRAEQREQES